MSTPAARPLAVVTGASSGIGLELARECARHGHDLVLVAQHGADDALAAVRAESADGQVLLADLATSAGVEEVASGVAALGRPVDVLALNAGLGLGGRFVPAPDGPDAQDTDLGDELRLIAVNVTSTVHLAKRLLPAMVARGSGRVLITSSISGTQPTTFEAVYGGTKAFQLSFAESLRAELEGSGVTVTALLPGPTDTDFFRRGRMDDTVVGSELKTQTSPAEVARQGYAAMMAGEDQVTGGTWAVKLQRQLNRLLPETVAARRHRAVAEPGATEG